MDIFWLFHVCEENYHCPFPSPTKKESLIIFVERKFEETEEKYKNLEAKLLDKQQISEAFFKVDLCIFVHFLI